jgi:hypothetical protein
MTAVSLPVLFLGAGAEASFTAAPEVDPPDRDVSEALKAAADWLSSTHQNADGGFSSFSAGADVSASDAGGTADALLALSSAGASVDSQLAYLRENVEQVSQYAALDGSTAGKLVLALVSAEVDPRDFGGQNFIVSLTGHLSPTGQFGVNTAFNQSLAILGLAAAREPVPDLAVEWLLDLQAKEGDLSGSWSDGFGTDGNADSTAMAMMALMASGKSGIEIAQDEAMAFLLRSQLQTGGWEYGMGFGENANSTALVLQALHLAGVDVASSDSDWIKGDASPLASLLSWQGESGAFQADFGEGRFDDFFSTVQTIPALAEVAVGSEQIFAPTISDESSSEQEPVEQDTPSESPVEEGTAEVVLAEEDSSSGQEPVEQPRSSESSEEDAPDETAVSEDEGGGGFSLCTAPLALSLFAGLVIIVPKRRRR